MKFGPWGVAALLVYLAIVALNLALAMPQPSVWLRMAEYGVWAVVLLGALARWRPGAGPFIWRPVMLLLGGALAAAEVGAWSRRLGLKFVIDEWMAALIGLALVAILARVLPLSWRAPWLGLPRHDTAGGGKP